MWVYYFLAAIAIWLGLNSLCGGIRFARYVRAELVREYPEFTPFVTVLVPCRGLDEGLKENLSAIFFQDYPAFEIIVVTDSADDPALAVVEEVRAMMDEHVGASVRIVIAGPAMDCGQKVHNLRLAVDKANSHAEVFAFVDTDVRPPHTWLRLLVRPLFEINLGATTGYRW